MVSVMNHDLDKYHPVALHNRLSAPFPVFHHRQACGSEVCSYNVHCPSHPTDCTGKGTAVLLLLAQYTTTTSTVH